MEKNTRTKNILLVVLLVAVLTLSISYAALSQTLTITSQATVKGLSGWNVRFTAASCAGQGYVTAQDITNFNPTNTTTLSGLAATLHAPGDAVVCDITVSNSGTIPATLDTFTLYDPTSTVVYTGTGATAQADEQFMEGKLLYSIVYGDDDAYEDQVPGSVVQEQGDTNPDPDALPVNGTRHLKLTISYPNSNTTLPQNDVTISGIRSIFVYKQA